MLVNPTDLIDGSVQLLQDAMMQALRLAWTQAGKEGVQAMLIAMKSMLADIEESVRA